MAELGQFILTNSGLLSPDYSDVTRLNSDQASK